MERITYDILKNALNGLENDVSVRNYKRILKNNFEEYAKEKGLHDLTQVEDKKELVQDFEKWLEEKGYSAQTIHTYLAPVCRGLDLDMAEIKKPLRTADKIMKGRALSERSQKIADNEKYMESVTLNKILGLRKSELKKISISSFRRDESGYWCVRVRGKGGKWQLQRILPEDLDTIREIAKSAQKEGRNTLVENVSNDANYHFYRAEVARKAYGYYVNTYQSPGEREKLRGELIRRFKACNIGYLNAKTDARKNSLLNAFVNELRDGSYVLRGASRRIAVQEGRPIAYDRLSVMAVSVFHLSHWRSDVTVINYLNK